MKRLNVAAVTGMLAAALLGSGGAQAANISSTLTLTATLSPTCTIVSVNTPALEAISVGSVIPTAAGSIMISCTNQATYNVALGPGMNGTDGILPVRYLRDAAGSTFQYQLWQDPTVTKAFGDTIGTNVVVATGTGSSQAVPFYFNTGVAPTTLTPGTYTDTVSVTVAY